MLEPAEGEIMYLVLFWWTTSEHQSRAFHPVLERSHNKGEGGRSQTDQWGGDKVVVKGMDKRGCEFINSKQGLQNMFEDGVERQTEDEDAWSLQHREKVGGRLGSTN